MNPFTESTVAAPLTDTPAPSRTPVIHKKSRRSFFGSTLRAMGLATTLGASASAPGSVVVVQGAGLLAALAAPGTAFAAAATSPAVNVNAATQAQLQGVRGIGPKMAQTIIAERQRGGPYESFEDLADRVKGIGPKKAAALQAGGLTVAGSTGAGTLTKPTAPAAAPPQDKAIKPSASSASATSSWSGIFKR